MRFFTPSYTPTPFSHNNIYSYSNSVKLSNILFKVSHLQDSLHPPENFRLYSEKDYWFSSNISPFKNLSFDSLNRGGSQLFLGTKQKITKQQGQDNQGVDTTYNLTVSPRYADFKNQDKAILQIQTETYTTPKKDTHTKRTAQLPQKHTSPLSELLVSLFDFGARLYTQFNPRVLIQQVKEKLFFSSAKILTYDSDADNPLPEIPGFKIVKELSGGAMGRIFIAEKSDLNRRLKFVIKIIKAGSFAPAKQKKLFKQEARVLNAIQHPNIVNIYKYGKHENLQYIVLEYVKGLNLYEYLSTYLRFKPTTERETIGAQILEQCLDGLSVLHNNGIIHRDIKPSNILIGDPSCLTPKIADFGCAIQTAKKSILVSADYFLGTPIYMSPERIGGDEPQKHMTDIYAMGVILYFMVTLKRPFNKSANESLSAFYYKLMHTEAKDPREIDFNISDQMTAIIKKALSKDPSDRYQSAEEFRQDLLLFLKGKDPVYATKTNYQGSF